MEFLKLFRYNFGIMGRFVNLASLLRRQKACCCLELRTGNLIYGWIHLAASTIVIFLSAAALFAPEDSNIGMPEDMSKEEVQFVLTGLLLMFCVGWVVAVCHLYGTYKYRENFLLPYLVLGALHLAGLAFLIVRLLGSGSAGAAVFKVLAFLLYFYAYLIPLSFYQEIREGRTPVEHDQNSIELQ